MKKTILISNDDGIHAPGIMALHKAVAGLGKAIVVAPATEQSGTGHSITVSNPLKIRKQKFDGQFEGYAITGTPADSVKIAASVLLKAPPHLLVSGINLGPNAGISVIYSGTVSAAIEGTILDIPSVAFSLDTFNDPIWDTAARVARLVAAQVLKKGIPSGVMLNVNIPNLPLEKIKGIVITRVAHSRFSEIFHRRTMPRGGGDYYWMDGDLTTLEDTKGTDVQAIRDGFVSITPVGFDLTNRAAMPGLRKWNLRL